MEEGGYKNERGSIGNYGYQGHIGQFGRFGGFQSFDHQGFFGEFAVKWIGVWWLQLDLELSDESRIKNWNYQGYDNIGGVVLFRQFGYSDLNFHIWLSIWYKKQKWIYLMGGRVLEKRWVKRSNLRWLKFGFLWSNGKSGRRCKKTVTNILVDYGFNLFSQRFDYWTIVVNIFGFKDDGRSGFGAWSIILFKFSPKNRRESKKWRFPKKKWLICLKGFDGFFIGLNPKFEVVGFIVFFRKKIKEIDGFLIGSNPRIIVVGFTIFIHKKIFGIDGFKFGSNPRLIVVRFIVFFHKKTNDFDGFSVG